jgi:hypothetical protein
MFLAVKNIVKYDRSGQHREEIMISTPAAMVRYGFL